MDNDLPNLTAALNPARPQNNMMQTAGAQALVQRTLGEVQVAVMMAKQFPRDKIEATEKLVNDCCREGLAMKATYCYSKGGTEISGPSIRLAEAAKNAWGNMQSGWRELSRTTVNNVGMSEIESFCWDSENNTRATVTFTVRHWRDTKQGGYAIKEEREIYELCANQAARRERACILKMIDGDMIEAALKQVQTTLTTKVQVTPERIASMVKAFSDEYKVTQEQIEKRIQRRIDAINPALMISLTKIYNSLREGMSKAEDWFDISADKKDIADPAKASSNPPTAEAKPKATATKKKEKPAHDPEIGEIHEEAAAQNQAAATGNPSLDFGE